MLSRYSLRTLLLTGAFLIAIIPLAVFWLGSARAIRSLSLADRMGNAEMLAQGLADDLDPGLLEQAGDALSHQQGGGGDHHGVLPRSAASAARRRHRR